MAEKALVDITSEQTASAATDLMFIEKAGTPAKINVGDMLGTNLVDVKDNATTAGLAVVTAADVAAQVLLIADILMPVGSIHVSKNAANPSAIFGGTWVAIEDVMLIGASSTYAEGATGGAATVVLTEAELASHDHADTFAVGTKTGLDFEFGGVQGVSGATTGSGSVIATDAGGGGTGGATYTYSADLNHNHTLTGSVSNAGSGQAHENMPPYLAVYMWERTA